MEFTDASGKDHDPGDVVQVFNLRGKTQFNIERARDILEKRRGGPLSVLLKSNRPFSLSEMEEVVPPSGAVFSTSEKYIRIF